MHFDYFFVKNACKIFLSGILYKGSPMSHRTEETIEWFHGQVGKATDCNSVIIGSSPVGTSICAQVAKLVDAQDLKSCGP